MSKDILKKRIEKFPVVISQIDPMDLSFPHMVLTDYELIVQTIYKLNDLIDVTNEYYSLVTEFIEWVTNDGLSEAVITQLNVWLNDGTLEQLVNQTLFNTKLDKVDFESFEQTQRLINNNLKDQCSVLSFGADPTGIEDSYQAFKNAITQCSIVTVPNGKFNLSQPLIIEATDKCETLKGNGIRLTELKFEEAGLIIQKDWLRIEKLKIKGNFKESGILLDGSNFNTIYNCDVNSFNIGIDLANSSEYVITALIDRTVVGYNYDYGIFIKVPNKQKNNIVISNCYINKNGGPNMDDLQFDGLTDRGDGIHIDGGYSINVYNTVLEYNAGCGIRVSSKTYNLDGVVLMGNYFERNKYANLYIDNSSSRAFLNVISKGSFYSDAGLTPVANAISERRAYITSPYKISNDFHKGVEIENFSYQYNKAKMLSIDPNNLFSDYNDLSYFERLNPKIIEPFNDIPMVVFRTWNAQFGEFFVRAKLKFGKKYKFSFKYTNMTGVITPNLSIVLYKDDGSDVIISKSLTLGGQSDEFKHYEFDFTSDFDMDARLYLNIEGNRPTSTMIILHSIKLEII